MGAFCWVLLAKHRPYVQFLFQEITRHVSSGKRHNEDEGRDFCVWPRDMRNNVALSYILLFLWTPLLFVVCSMLRLVISKEQPTKNKLLGITFQWRFSLYFLGCIN